MEYIILLIVGLIIGFVVLYQIIKFQCTEYKRKQVVILKNEMTSEWLGGTETPFNLIGNIPGLMGDKVYIEQKDKFVFGKLVKTSFSIEQSFMDDDDEYPF